MIYTHESRKSLEKHIIGAAVLEDAYGQIAHVLKPANFTKHPEADHQMIWGTLQSMWPHKPIDLITVYHEIYNRHRVNYSYILADCTQSISGADHLIYWAFVLLEIDIREKFCNTVLNWKLKMSKDLNAAATLQEAYNYVSDPANDLFATVPGAIRWLRMHGQEGCADDMKDMDDQLDRKALKIKRLDHYHRLKAQVQKLENEFETIALNREVA